MKILKNVVLSALLTTSTMAMSDDSVVAGASNDILGVPAGALLLTELEATDARGQAWRAYRDAKQALTQCKSGDVGSQTEIICYTFNQDKIYLKSKWLSWKIAYDADPTDWRERKYLASY